MKNLYLIRHAESQANLIGDVRICGQSNETTLTLDGENQSSLLGEYILKKKLKFDSIFCSDSVRTSKTCELVCDKVGFNFQQVIQSGDLREQSQGDWEGGIRSLYYTPDIIDKITRDCYNFKAPNGESQKDVEFRVFNFLYKRILEENKVNDSLVFTHGNAIRIILRKILSSNPIMNINIGINNTSITKIVYDNCWKIGFINSYPHLNI